MTICSTELTSTGKHTRSFSYPFSTWGLGGELPNRSMSFKKKYNLKPLPKICGGIDKKKLVRELYASEEFECLKKNILKSVDGKIPQEKKPKKKKKRNLDKRKNRKQWRYADYIVSKAWERRRNLYWKTHKKRCAICYSAKFIHLHHTSYRKLGNEKDEHLIPLCAEHHRQFHEKYKSTRDMVEITRQFIENAKHQRSH